jgi:phosphoenolpyruvate-protein kinase (PTS system EI component)
MATPGNSSCIPPGKRSSATTSSWTTRRASVVELESKRGAATETIDGRAITVSANIEIVDELPLVKRSGAKGIGLYRTEFLLLNGEEMPDEEHQTGIYSRSRGKCPPTV